VNPDDGSRLPSNGHLGVQRSAANLLSADWLQKGLPNIDPYKVASVFPDQFAAYARIEHKAQGRTSRQLPEKTIRALFPLLRDATTTPDRCWFCVWGPGGHFRAHTLLHPFHGSTSAPRRGPMTRHRFRRWEGPSASQNQLGLCRTFHLYTTKLSDIGPLRGFPWSLAPDVWWPDDHAWCVASEAHFTWSYLGGCRRLIDQVCAHPLLDGQEVRPDDPVAR
jgi:hypothetical protein